MAKRYYDGGSLKHNRDEFNDEMRNDQDGSRRGELRRVKNEGDYAGESARRTQEMEDGGMIRENRAAIANLPQEVMIKPYPKTGPYLPEELDDTIASVDAQMDGDDMQRRKHFFPKKTS